MSSSRRERGIFTRHGEDAAPYGLLICQYNLYISNIYNIIDFDSLVKLFDQNEKSKINSHNYLFYCIGDYFDISFMKCVKWLYKKIY